MTNTTTSPLRLLACLLLGVLVSLGALIAVAHPWATEAATGRITGSPLTYELACVDETAALDPTATASSGPVAHNTAVLTVVSKEAAVLVRCRVSDVRRYGVPVKAFTVDTTAPHFTTHDEVLADGSVEITLLSGEAFDQPSMLPAGEYGAAFSVSESGFTDGWQRASVVGIVVAAPGPDFIGTFLTYLPHA